MTNTIEENSKRILEEKYLNKKFNKLTVIEINYDFDLWQNKSGRTKRKRIALCICDCGVKKKIRLESVIGGYTKSCGCLKLERSKENMKLAHKAQFRRPPRLGSASHVYRSSYLDGDITFDRFLELSQQNCFWCGNAPSNLANPYKYNYKNPGCTYSEDRKNNGDFIYNGLDRLDSSRGHFIDNIVPACKDCNVAKMARSVEDFLDWIDRVHKLHCGNR